MGWRPDPHSALPLGSPPMSGSLQHALHAVAGLFSLSGTAGWFQHRDIYSSLPPGHRSVPHSHSSPAASEVQKRASTEQPSCSARGALRPHRAGLKPSTAGIGNFQNPSLYSPKQAFESHIPQLRLISFSLISPITHLHMRHRSSF